MTTPEKTVFEEVQELINKCEAFDQLAPSQAVAEKLMVFRSLLSALKVATNRTQRTGEVTKVRHKLFEQTKEFSSQLSTMAEKVGQYGLGNAGKHKLFKQLQAMAKTTDELQTMVSERRGVK
jgi:hypothetical protein